MVDTFHPPSCSVHCCSQSIFFFKASLKVNDKKNERQIWGLCTTWSLATIKGVRAHSSHTPPQWVCTGSCCDISVFKNVHCSCPRTKRGKQSLNISPFRRLLSKGLIFSKLNGIFVWAGDQNAEKKKTPFNDTSVCVCVWITKTDRFSTFC